MEDFSYKRECSMHVCMYIRVSRHLKEELPWAIDEWLQVICNKMLRI